jgi:predicted Holliday junction resolvase-like endonuclease
MTNILALITVMFLVLIIYLITKIQLDRQKFHSRIKILEDFIVQISNEQKAQNNQLQLSEELKKKLTHINATLSKDIYDVNFKLVEELYSGK